MADDASSDLQLQQQQQLLMGNASNTTMTMRSFKDLQLLVAAAYALLSLSVVFNLRVIYVVIRILRANNTALARANAENSHTLVYVLALSVVDSLVLMHLPVVVTDILLNRWVFGTAMCKLYYTIDQINRVLSTFILTALSGDRFLAVCMPTRSRMWRTQKMAVVVVMICVLVAAIQLSPAFIKTSVVPFPLSENRSIDKCMLDQTDPNIQEFFFIYMFCCGFCVPYLSMLFFYGSILRTLWKRQAAAANRRSLLPQPAQQRAQQVTLRTLVLVLFYFACWVPYWTIMMYLHFGDPDNSMPDIAVIVMYLVHVLAYVNSAINPFLYAKAARELQRQQSSHSQLRNKEQQSLKPGKRKKCSASKLLSPAVSSFEQSVIQNGCTHKL